MPRIKKKSPAYVQIADHYRAQIRDGLLPPGAKLPSVIAMAKDWHVSTQTTARALRALAVEGAVFATPNGTFAADAQIITRTPLERVRAGSALRPGEAVEVTAAGIVIALPYVAELLGIDQGGAVIRREEVTSRDGRPVMLSVDWIPGLDAVSAGELLALAPVEGGIAAFTARARGRTLTHGEDHLRGRACDQREADHLRVPPGSPVLAGVHLLSDAKGPLLYGEWVLRPDLVVRYAYQLGQ